MVTRESNGVISRMRFQTMVSCIAAITVGISCPLLALAQQPEESPPAAALLQIDPELEYRLGRADELASMGEYVVVIPIWQEALDASRDVMHTRDGQLYRPIGLEIEKTICNLPPQALRAYRLTADGQVAAILAEAKTTQERELALAQIVQRYFLSTQGDEAAYELACRALDRHDFVYTAHLLRRVLDDYPETNVDHASIYLRLAVAQVELGARADAAECMEQYHALQPDSSGSALSVTIASHIEEVPSAPASKSEPGTWHMRMGTLAGDGAQTPPPSELLEGELIEMWHHDFRTGSGISASLAASTGQLPAFRGLQDMPRADLPRDGAILQKQQFSQWVAFREEAQYAGNQPFAVSGHPNGQLLFDDNRIYFKTPTRMVCTDATTGRILWQGLPSSFAPDLNSELYLWLRREGHTLPTPSESLSLYGDRINDCMAIFDGQIFSIEGDAELNHIDLGRSGYELMQTGVPRTRYNFLTAYDADNGKVLWRFPGGREFYRDGRTDENPDFYELGFMGPPAPMARLVLAPVSREDGLWLYALDRRNGELVWQTFLCEELHNASDPWAPVGIVVEGGEVYVSTGSSAVLALDSRTGAVRWALHYDAISPYNGFRGFYYGDYGYEFHVWEENFLSVYGNAILLMASDSDCIQARDRRDGKLLWESPITVGESSASYFMGILGDRIYLAGPNVVRCIDVTDGQGNPTNGRIVWEKRSDPQSEGVSFGRGVVTEEGIFQPFNDTILHLDPATGEVLRELAVSKPASIDPANELPYVPVGNLYSDGQWLHMVSPGRISAWGTADLREHAWSLPEGYVPPSDETSDTLKNEIPMEGDSTPPTAP